MKKILLAVLICLALVTSAYAGVVADAPLKTDLVGKRVLETGAIKRVSGATYIHDGVLYTADGDDTPFSHTSVENEAGATGMLGSFVDDQTWFRDAGGLIAVYAGTGNLLIINDGTGKLAYGFLGEVGTGLVSDPLANNVTAITKANPGVVSSVAHGLVVGDLVYFDSLTEMTELNLTFQVVTVLDSANTFSINDTSGYDAETTGGACAHEVTEPPNTGVHIYKEYGLLNEGWNADDIDDYNAGASWDFDVYVNLMTATGSTAQARFEDGWLLFEPEGTNLITYSEDFSQWTASEITLDTSEADPRGGTGATGLVSSAVAGQHSLLLSSTFADNADGTYSLFAKPGARTWLRLLINTKANDYESCFFNLSGAGSVGAGSTADNESIERLGTTDWYRIRITSNIHTGATAPRIFIHLAEADNDLDFTGDGTTIDTFVYGADAKQDLFLTSYIPTNGIPVTRTTEAGSAADNGISWTTPQVLLNILDDAQPGGSPTDSQGTLTFQIKWGCDESDITGWGSLISSYDGSSLAYFSSDTYFVYDGTADSGYAHPAFSAGDEITYASRWGDVDGETDDLSAGFKYSGTWFFDPTPGAYDGEFTLGTKIRLGYGCLYPFHIRNVKFYDIPYSQAQVEAGLEAPVLKWMLNLEFP